MPVCGRSSIGDGTGWAFGRRSNERSVEIHVVHKTQDGNAGTAGRRRDRIQWNSADLPTVGFRAINVQERNPTEACRSGGPEAEDGQGETPRHLGDSE